MDKRSVKTHFQYCWWVYLLIIIAATVLWIAIFTTLAKPKSIEVLNITIVGEIDESGLAEELKLALDGKTKVPLKEVNIEVVSGNNPSLVEIIAMRCLGDTDIIIFADDYLVTPLSANFAPIDTEKANIYFGDITMYAEDGKSYGFLICEEETLCNFGKYKKTDKKYWAFITSKSENAGALNGCGSSENVAALLALKYLTEVE